MSPRIRSSFTSLIWLTLAGLPALHADVTLRYKSEITINPNLPPQFAQQIQQAVGSNFPPDQTLRLKDNRIFNEFGKLSSIFDFSKGEITLLDPTGKRFAIVPADRYGDEMAAAVSGITGQAKAAMPGMTAHTESRVTGRTATIQGVAAEEREITFTVEGPPMPNMPAGPMQKLVIHMWTAKAGEAERVPAIGELAKHDLMQLAGVDPFATVAKMLEQMPGMKDALATMMKEMHAAASHVSLRMETEVFVPMLSALMKQAGGASDADTALVHATLEVSEISTAPVPDSAFQVPEGYQSAPAADLLKDMLRPKTPAAR